MKRKYIISGKEFATAQQRGATGDATSSLDELDGFDLDRIIEPSTTRGDDTDIEIEVDDDDLVHIEFEDGTFWLIRGGELPELFDDDPSNRGGDGTNAIRLGAVIPQQASDRSVFKKVLVKA